MNFESFPVPQSEGSDGVWTVTYSCCFADTACPDARAEGGGGFGKGNSSREQKHQPLPLLWSLGIFKKITILTDGPQPGT